VLGDDLRVTRTLIGGVEVDADHALAPAG